MKTEDKIKYSQNSNLKHRALVFALKIFAGALLLGGLVTGVWLATKNYENKIYPRVTVAGLKIGGLAQTDAKRLVDNYVAKINAEGPTIIYADQKFTPRLSELGVKFDTQKTIEEAYNFGRKGSWTNQLKEKLSLIYKSYNIDLSPELNEEQLDEYLGQIANVLEITPQDATLEYSRGEWILKNASQGQGLNKNRLKNSINQFIQTGQNQGEIELETTVLEPAVNEAAALAAKPNAENLLKSAPIELEYKDDSLKFVAERAEIASWVVFVTDGANLRAEVSDQKIAEYVDWMASKIEIKKIDKEVVDGTNEVKIEGQDGRGVNKNELMAQIKARVLAGAVGQPINIVSYKIPKETIVIYPAAQPGRYAGRYIDINLSEQKIYGFEGTNLLNSFLISSGKRGYETPTGEYSVWTKVRRQVMDGPDYYLPNVQWISYFNGEIGIHGAYWHNNFGHPMSHGCINARNADAEWVYNFVDIGTPVYVHY